MAEMVVTVDMTGRCVCVTCTVSNLVFGLRYVEYVNGVLKHRNISYSGFDGLVEFSHNLKATCHVDCMYSEAFGEALDTPMTARGNYQNDVKALLRYYQRMIPSSHDPTSINPFQGVNGVELDLGDYRLRKPWEFVKAVAQGSSAAWGTNVRQSAGQYVDHYLDDCMYKY